MQDVEPGRKTVGPGKLDRVQFLFQNSGMVGQDLGHGYMAWDLFSYTNELGLYAAGTSKKYFAELRIYPR